MLRIGAQAKAAQGLKRRGSRGIGVVTSGLVVMMVPLVREDFLLFLETKGKGASCSF